MIMAQPVVELVFMLSPNSKLRIRWIKIFWWIICFRNVSKKVAKLSTYLCAFICSSSATKVTSPSSKLRIRWKKIHWWIFLFQKCIKKKVAANLSKYLCAFICSSSATIVTLPIIIFGSTMSDGFLGIRYLGLLWILWQKQSLSEVISCS